MSLWRLSAFIC